MTTVAETISRCLVAEGVKLAAGMSGQQIGPLLDQIAGRDEIALMYARQERVAFDICDGYARATGNPGVVFTDSGPAAANLMCLCQRSVARVVSSDCSAVWGIGFNEICSHGTFEAGVHTECRQLHGAVDGAFNEDSAFTTIACLLDLAACGRFSECWPGVL